MYDEYSTPARWSRITLAYTTRIAWCCLFSYFIGELQRDGLWACPQFSSYSWWGLEYYMYHCWQTIPSTFGEKLMYASYTTDRPGSSVGHPLGALALICLCVLLTWLTYAYGMLCQDNAASWRVFTTPMCMPIVLTGHFNSCMLVINYWSLYHQGAW